MYLIYQEYKVSYQLLFLLGRNNNKVLNSQCGFLYNLRNPWRGYGIWIRG